MRQQMPIKKSVFRLRGPRAKSPSRQENRLCAFAALREIRVHPQQFADNSSHRRAPPCRHVGLAGRRTDLTALTSDLVALKMRYTGVFAHQKCTSRAPQRTVLHGPCTIAIAGSGRWAIIQRAEQEESYNRNGSVDPSTEPPRAAPQRRGHVAPLLFGHRNYLAANDLCSATRGPGVAPLLGMWPSCLACGR